MCIVSESVPYVRCDAGSTVVISHSRSRDIVSGCAVFPLAVAVSELVTTPSAAKQSKRALLYPSIDARRVSAPVNGTQA